MHNTFLILNSFLNLRRKALLHVDENDRLKVMK